MKYAVEMGSGAMIYVYIPSFIKNGSDIQNFIKGYKGLLLFKKDGILLKNQPVNVL
jgi:hypothetical protein